MFWSIVLIDSSGGTSPGCSIADMSTMTIALLIHNRVVCAGMHASSRYHCSNGMHGELPGSIRA